MDACSEPFAHGYDKAVEPDDVEHAGEVVAQRHQAPLAAHLVEAAHEEVAIAGTAFERAEGMLSEGGPAPHYSAGFGPRHPRAMAVDYGLMLPAMDLASSSLVGEAPRANRTGTADRL
ncbi:MAG: hypothetical protein QOI40_4103, partial [Alphaproteobacteria bacterium]|nr:hypothetical protein [Alphaproteobacteria bacterium]